MTKLFLLHDTFKSAIGYCATLFLTFKPVEWDDTLGIIGKIVWILASLLATIWWSGRLYDKYFKKKK